MKAITKLLQPFPQNTLKDILLKLGRNICVERNRAGLPQETLAERANMNKNILDKLNEVKLILKSQPLSR